MHSEPTVKKQNYIDHIGYLISAKNKIENTRQNKQVRRLTATDRCGICHSHTVVRWSRRWRRLAARTRTADQ